MWKNRPRWPGGSFRGYTALLFVCRRAVRISSCRSARFPLESVVCFLFECTQCVPPFVFCPCTFHWGSPPWSAFRYTQKKGSFCQGALENFFCSFAICRKRGRFGAPHKQKNKPSRRKICEMASIGLIFSRFRDMLRKTFRVS